MAESVTLTVTGGVARVTLDRPDVRNAFNVDLIAQLYATFTRINAADDVRVVVLSGEGKVFCGGADINWMRASLDLGYDKNLAAAEKMSDMFRAIDNCSKPVIGRIFGAALGGGAGLAAVCDVAIASDDTIFGFTEVKLGIIPAVISPFVLAKIGASNARRFFLTGERFDAHRARAIGLVHEVVQPAELDAAVAKCVVEIGSAGPHAVSAVKLLLRRVMDATYDESRDVTANAIAHQRITPEGQEGLRAFLERRKPSFDASEPS